MWEVGVKNNIMVSNQVWFLLVSLVVLPIQVQAVTMQEKLINMLKEHPKLKSAKAAGQSAAWDVERATDNYFPVFSINAETGPDKYTSSITTFGQERKLEHTKVTYELRQNLFRGFRDQAAVSASRAKKKIADYLQDSVIQELLLQGVSAYVDGLRVKQLENIINEKVDIAKQLLDMKKASRASGASTDVDVLEALLVVQRTLDEKLLSNADFRAAQIKYAQLFNDSRLSDEMSSINFPETLKISNIEQALKIAAENSIGIAIARMRVDVARNEKKNSAGEYYPTIDLVGRYDYERNSEGREGKSLQELMLVEFSWRFNIANQVGAAVSSAAEKISVALFEYDAIIKDTEQNVRLAYERYKNLRDRLVLVKKSLKIAVHILDSRIIQRKVGKINKNIVIGARANMLSAKQAVMIIRFEVLKSGFEFAYVTGILTQVKLGLSNS